MPQRETVAGEATAKSPTLNNSDTYQKTMTQRPVHSARTELCCEQAFRVVTVDHAAA